MKSFSEKLGFYLYLNKIPKKLLAEYVGVDPQTVSNWLHHNIRPHRKYAELIVKFSKDYITLKDCGYEIS